MSRCTRKEWGVAPVDVISATRRGERDLGATARAYRAAQSSRARASRQTARAGRVRFGRRCPCGAVGPGVRYNRRAASGGTDFRPPVAFGNGASAAAGAIGQRGERGAFGARVVMIPVRPVLSGCFAVNGAPLFFCGLQRSPAARRGAPSASHAIGATATPRAHDQAPSNEGVDGGSDS
jgi:hypothetical protein